MRKLFMKQQVFSLTDKFSVKNEVEEDVYEVNGDFLTVGGKKLHIMDVNGREVAMVRQKLLSLMPRFIVTINDEQVAMIVKKISFFKAKYKVEGPGWEVNGSILDHDYKITDNGREIVSLHKVWLSWGDSYEIDIADGTDEVLALATVIAIDCVKAEQDQSAAYVNTGN